MGWTLAAEAEPVEAMGAVVSWAQTVEWAQEALTRVLLWAQGALRWSQSVTGQFQNLPADVALTIAAYCSIVALLALVAWARSSAQRQRALRALANLESATAELQNKLDAEVKWRTAGERVNAPRA